MLENEKIRMTIPLHFKGAAASPGVKKGGVVSHLRNDVDVSCLPKDLPEFLEVDVSGLGMNQMLYLADLQVPEGVEILELVARSQLAGRLDPSSARRGSRSADGRSAAAAAAAAAAAGAPRRQPRPRLPLARSRRQGSRRSEGREGRKDAKK